MYDYGSAEDNMKHYGVVSVGVCVVVSVGESVGCVCWEGSRKEREEHGASVLYTESDEKLVGYETVVLCVERRRKERRGWK